jgi:hypothetical protein
MSVASEVAEIYARAWDIPETPILGKRCTSISTSPYDISNTTPSTSGIGNYLPSAIDSLPTGLIERASRLHGWTPAAAEDRERSQQVLRRHLRAMGYIPIEDQPVPVSRSEQALAAIRELAQWMNVSEPDAAELAGGYRRSYYNWQRGSQPYPAKTLDLFEAHALVAALVDSLDIRGARKWLNLTTEGQPRVTLLCSAAGRDKLSRLATRLIFPAAPHTGAWQPDDEATHTPSPTAPPRSKRTLKVVARPPLRRPSD